MRKKGHGLARQKIIDGGAKGRVQASPGQPRSRSWRWLGGVQRRAVGTVGSCDGRQPFSQKPRTPTVAKEFQIGLCGVVEADLELFCNCWSAGFLGERLYERGCERKWCSNYTSQKLELRYQVTKSVNRYTDRETVSRIATFGKCQPYPQCPDQWAAPPPVDPASCGPRRPPRPARRQTQAVRGATLPVCRPSPAWARRRIGGGTRG